MVSAYLELLAAAAMLACCVYAAYALAVRICPAAPLSVRCCAAVLAAAWLQVALFEVLVSLHAFRLAVALPAWLAVAILFHFSFTGRDGPLSGEIRRQARADWQALCHAAREICSGEVRVLLILVGALSTAHLLHSLVAPPLAWDSLTYQFVRPAVWVQTAGMAVQPAPDAWSYYAYFPYTGNIFWAWAMLPVHGELLLGPMGFAIWLSLQLAVYTAARLLGAGRRPAVLAALTIGITPAVFAYLIAGYVDNTLLTAFLLGTVFLIRTYTGHRREALPAVAAFGLAAGVKLTGVILLGLASVALAGYLFRRRDSLKQWLGHLAVGSAAAVVGILPYLRNWVGVGSPLYPTQLRLFGVNVFAGNEQLAAVLSGQVFAEPQPLDELRFLRATFVPGPQFTSLGLVAPLLIGLGLFGLIVLLRRRGLRIPVTLMLVCSAVTVAMLYSPEARGIRAHWPVTCGRFLMPALACCVLWAAAPGHPVLRQAFKWTCYAAIGFGLLLGLPRGWSPADVKAIGIAAPCVLAAGCVLWTFLRAIRRSPAARIEEREGKREEREKHAGHPSLFSLLSSLLSFLRSFFTAGRIARTTGAAAALMVAGMVVLPLTAVRQHYRYAIYRAAETRRSWITHRLHPDYASAWPIWRYFDTQPGQRIAVTAGFEDAGHNWYRYPLLGSRLQNRLLYVPITTDGRIVNYRNLDRRDRDSVTRIGNPSYTAWVQRLIDQRVEYVVSLAPDNTLESQWMAALPELFEPVAASADGLNRAYRFRPPETVRVAQGRCAIPVRRK